ncbi:hypothetical protein VNI00_012634 [Paramarasmius palmivorus]|uniref:NADAR domain-containing protein n=1 Tax=Paramarasmius palmivorus TaxID=297713 RepID=A0AAW0C7H4_9AGAR
MPLNKDDYIFFWTPDGPNGWASQWYQSPFEVPIVLPNETTATLCKFPTAEHWMMFQKALLFNDIAIAKEVLSHTGVEKEDLAVVKALGRGVKNFDEEKWVANRERIVLEGSLHKFKHNPELKIKLLETGEKRMVEASPRDRIWGIGFGAESAGKMVDEKKWGLNLLGKALDEARKQLSTAVEGES